jgi:hypothetical protein
MATHELVKRNPMWQNAFEFEIVTKAPCCDLTVVSVSPDLREFIVNAAMAMPQKTKNS